MKISIFIVICAALLNPVVSKDVTDTTLPSHQIFGSKMYFNKLDRFGYRFDSEIYVLTGKSNAYNGKYSGNFRLNLDLFNILEFRGGLVIGNKLEPSGVYSFTLKLFQNHLYGGYQLWPGYGIAFIGLGMELFHGRVALCTEWSIWDFVMFLSQELLIHLRFSPISDCELVITSGFNPVNIYGEAEISYFFAPFTFYISLLVGTDNSFNCVKFGFTFRGDL